MKKFKVRIGLRTIKTAVAIIVAMLVVDHLGTTPDKLIFAMLGAMSAMAATFRESLAACISQIIGVVFGALVGLALTSLPLSPLVAIGIGVVLIITVYNMLQFKESPSLPCFILVLICISDSISPISYATGRIWDTAIGLGIGMLINLLVFPYDNSQKIKASIESLDRDLILFLEDMFDGDTNLPDADKMNAKLKDMEQQLSVFESQLFLIHARRQRMKLEQFRRCDRKAKELVARLQILSNIERPGRLSEESRRRLAACGATIRDERPLNSVMELDVVTNYHVRQILQIRHELLDTLNDHRGVSGDRE